MIVKDISIHRFELLLLVGHCNLQAMPPAINSMQPIKVNVEYTAALLCSKA